MNHKMLKDTRVEAGVTQETMASALGYKDKSSYCLLENGGIKCTVDQAKIIKDVLGLTTELYEKIFLV